MSLDITDGDEHEMQYRDGAGQDVTRLVKHAPEP